MDQKESMRRKYVTGPRKTATAYFFAAVVLSVPSIAWALGALHWTSPDAWFVPAACGIFATGSLLSGIVYRFFAAKCEKILQQ